MITQTTDETAARLDVLNDRISDLISNDNAKHPDSEITWVIALRADTGEDGDYLIRGGTNGCTFDTWLEMMTSQIASVLNAMDASSAEVKVLCKRITKSVRKMLKSKQLETEVR